MKKEIICLFIGIFGVIGYRELPFYWHLLMWIPITLGFGLWNRKIKK